ncbi:MAG: family 10 glycosylhydrolase [Planctomycetes bacterium]|nr:family 10 glycosylhydrolase [Planctomycetota bacterium]
MTSRTRRCLVALVLVGGALMGGGCAGPQGGYSGEALLGEQVDLDALPRAEFDWKALWVWISPTSSRDDVLHMVDLAADCGFNVIIVNTGHRGVASYKSRYFPMAEGQTIDVLGEAIAAAHQRDLQVYAWVTYLYNSGVGTFQKEHPDHLQVLLPEEEALAAAKTRSDPDRVDVQGGSWLCPDRGLTDYERGITDEIVRNYDLDGVAIDFLGYRNYRACYCDYSKARRADFAKAHPELSEEQVLATFSEQSLAEFSRQVRQTVLAAKPRMKLAAHVYPDFDPNPLYGNRLALDYCGQTIAWFFKPHWSFERILERQRAFMAAQGEHVRGNHHVAFIGCRTGDVAKSPERLRREIRLAGAAGCRCMMFAFHETLHDDPALAEAVRRELAP